MLRPSEHIYLPMAAMPILYAGLKKLSTRLADAQAGRYHHRRDSVLFTPQPLFIDREYDGELAREIHKLKHRVRQLGRHGKLRLNVISVTLLAFATRSVREHPVSPSFDLRLFERKLENARRRLQRATVHKFGGKSFEELHVRWSRFSRWMRYYILCDKPPRDSGGLGNVRKIYAEQRAAVRAWIRELIVARSEDPLPDVLVDRLATLFSRHVRRGRVPGITLRKILKTRNQYDDLVFDFVNKRVDLKLKREYLDVSRLWSSRFKNRRNAPQAPEVSGSPPTHLDLPACTENEWVERVAAFLRENVEYSSWWPIAKQIPLNLPSDPAPAKGSANEMLKLARPDWEPAYGYQQPDWEAEWIQRWLTPFVGRSRIRDIVSRAVQLAQKQDGSRGVQAFVS